MSPELDYQLVQFVAALTNFLYLGMAILLLYVIVTGFGLFAVIRR